jgi:hypothetical protein
MDQNTQEMTKPGRGWVYILLEVLIRKVAPQTLRGTRLRSTHRPARAQTKNTQETTKPSRSWVLS